MYMTHIMVFIYFGWFDRRMDAYGTAGNLAVVDFASPLPPPSPPPCGMDSNRASCG